MSCLCLLSDGQPCTSPSQGRNFSSLTGVPYSIVQRATSDTVRHGGIVCEPLPCDEENESYIADTEYEKFPEYSHFLWASGTCPSDPRPSDPQLKKEVGLLDFTNIPEPNILNVPDYFAYRFLYGFQNAITQHVGEIDSEKHKYVPTQIMRDLIENDFSRAGIMGIKYRSVKNDGQPNVVLFLDNNTCGEWLELIDRIVKQDKY